MTRPMVPGAFALLPILALAACANSKDVSVYKSVNGRYADAGEVKTMVAEQIPVSRNGVLGIQANLNGAPELVRDRLDGGVLFTGPVPAPEAQRYLEKLRDKLLRNWKLDQPNPPPRIEITANNTYNAESLSDDTVQISIGVLQRAESEDELAFVLGHELGHLLLKHQARRRQTLDQTETAVQVAATAAMLAAMIATGHKTAPNTITLQAGPSAAAIGGKFVSDTTTAEVITTLINPEWSRRQEEQADLIGVDLATAAGYNPAAAAHAFASIMADEKAAADKAEQMRKQIEEARKNDTTAQNAGDAIGDIFNSFKQELIDLRVNHPATGAREQALSEYRDANYSVETARPQERKALPALRASRPFIALKNGVDSVNKANDLFAQGELAKAAQEARAAQKGFTNWWAPYYVGGVAELAQNHGRVGMDLLRTAASRESAPYGVYERLAFELSNTNQHAAAMQVMNDAENRLNDKEVTLPDRIVLARRAKNETMVGEILALCRNSSHHRLLDACTEAANGALEPGKNLSKSN